MITKFLYLIFVGLFSSQPHTHHELCSGFFPENDMQIPVSISQVGGMTESEFNAVLDRVEAHYAPIVRSEGAELRIIRSWEDSTVNAMASRSGNRYIIEMFGGLARHPSISPDGFMLVACHEMGHHLGGAPKLASFWGMSDWATNEGGADYFATLRCLRALYDDRETEDVLRNSIIDPHLRLKCEETYNTQEEENFCIRSGLAGHSTSDLFKEMRKITKELSFEHPDTNVVSSTFDGHPEPQCRLDTYFQGALCVHDMSVGLSDEDYRQGTCTDASGATIGIRPRCWFNP